MVDTKEEDTLVLTEELPLSALDASPPANAVTGPSGAVYHTTSFGLRPHQFPRRQAIKLVEWASFDSFILGVIVCNCITMAWQSPLDPTGTRKQEFLAIIEWAYLLIFGFELCAKMLAKGVIGHPHAYLSDPWCQLDFVVVTLAWAPKLFPTLGNVSAIRTVRALRPLRALKRVPGMPVLVESILASIPALTNVMYLAAFIFLIFGMVGMNLFKGVLHYRCAVPMDPSRGRALKGGGGHSGGGDVTDMDADVLDTGLFCYSKPDKCLQYDASCYYFAENPDGGTISFDSTAAAIIPVLQAVTFDCWTMPMYDVMNGYSYSAWVFFILVASIGGFFLVNLFLAVIYDEVTLQPCPSSPDPPTLPLQPCPSNPDPPTLTLQP